MRRMSGQAAIETEFASLDEGLDRELTAFLMGGGAMTFHGLKNGTRDLDLLVTTRSDFELLRDLLHDRGYETVQNPIDEYASLGAAIMLDKDDECRFDLFDREVMRKLRLSDRMQMRATTIFDGSQLHVRALSNEDIFLFKGVAGRRRDTDDMALLLEAGEGVEFDVITEEFQAQLPLNTGDTEWGLLTGAPANHPVIAFERAVLSLPMTLPTSFTNIVEQEADRVYAEFEIVTTLRDRREASIADLTARLDSRESVPVSDRNDIEGVIESLVAKELVARDGEMVRLDK